MPWALRSAEPVSGHQLLNYPSSTNTVLTRLVLARAEASFSMSDQSAQPLGLEEAGQEHPKVPEQPQPALSEKVQQFVGSLRLPGSIGALWSRRLRPWSAFATRAHHVDPAGGRLNIRALQYITYALLSCSLPVTGCVLCVFVLMMLYASTPAHSPHVPCRPASSTM